MAKKEKTDALEEQVNKNKAGKSEKPDKSKSEKPDKVDKSEKKKKSVPILQRIKRFFQELVSEGKKVVWPTKKQMINNTGIVLAFSVISGAIIWCLDAVFTLGIQLVYGFGG